MAGEKIAGITIPIGASIEGFIKELKKVDGEIKKTEKTADTLSKSLQVEWNNDKFIQAQKQAQRAVDDSTAKIEVMKKELERFSQGNKVDTKEFKQLQEDLISSEAKAVLLKKKLEEINDLKINHIAGQFKDLGDSISNAGKKLLGVSAAAVGALAGITAIFNTTVTAAAELDDLSQSINLNAESLQRWRYVANQSGLDNTTLQTALAKTQSAFAKLAEGELTTASQSLIRLGFTTEQAAQGMDVNFDLMVQRLSEVSDATEQAYLANQLFGDRLGSRVIPLLKNGSQGLNDLKIEFESIGYLTNEQVSTLAKYDDQWLMINTTLKEVKNQLAVSLLPLFQSLTNLMKDRLLPVIKSVAEWFGGLSDSSKSIITGILAFTAALAPVLLIVGKLTSSFGSMIPMLAKLGGSLGSLVGIPVVGWIIGIVALIAALYASNENFRNSINQLVSTLASALMPVLETLGQLFSMVLSAVMPLIEAIGQALTPIIQILSSDLETVMAVLMPLLGPVMNMLKGAISIILSRLQPLLTIIKLLGGVLNWLQEVWQNVFSGILKVMNPVLTEIEKWVNGAIDLINHLIESINSIGSVLGLSIDKLEHVELSIGSTKNSTVPVKESTIQPNVNNSVDNAITQSSIENNYTTTTNNDYSNKNINIEVVVQNYAEEVDVDNLVQQINIKLAEQM